MEEYNFEIQHIAGKNNVVADALSRISIDDIKEVTEYEKNNIFAIQTRSMKKKQNTEKSTEESNLISLPKPKAITELVGYEKNTPRIRIRELIGDKVTGEIVQIKMNLYHRRKVLTKIEMNATANDKLSLNTILSRLQSAADALKINKIQWPLNDTIFKLCTEEEFKKACNETLNNLIISLVKPCIIINDEQEKIELLHKYHNDPLYGGHCGRNRLYAKLKSMYYWKNMSKNVTDFVKNCTSCLLNKPKTKNRENLLQTKTPQSPFDKVVIDTIGPFTSSIHNNKYAVTMICDLTKYLVTVPVPDKGANEVAKAIFEKIYLDLWTHETNIN